MVSRDDLVAFLDQLLPSVPGVEDPSNNGLQVEGKDQVKTVLFGVDACGELFERAIACNADFVFVHHGLSWGDGWKRLTGLTAARMRLLFSHGISLYAAHLPLDANARAGHNFSIARCLGLEQLESAFEYNGGRIGCWGILPRPTGLEQLSRMIEQELATECRVFAFGRDQVRNLGIVSGGGADVIAECARNKVDCLLTGEVKHQHYHEMAELGQNVIAAGHYRTETPGLQATARILAEHFEVDIEVVDLPTGM